MGRYVLHLWVAPERTEHQGVLGRLKFMLTFFALVDLASIAPFYVDLALNGFGPSPRAPRTAGKKDDPVHH